VNEREAFLTTIAAQPEDDTPRLVFADWLDEHDGVLGAGRSAYNWYATKSFVFMCGNEWWCDGTGRVTST
jgi:uncharacterized protein (TIGR02996 family)